MSLDHADFVKVVMEEIFGVKASFDLILEATLNEETQWVAVEDWSANKERWGVDEHNAVVGSREDTLTAEDFNNTAVAGESISKSKEIFLPSMFAIDKEDARHLVLQIGNLLRNEAVTVSLWPGYGLLSKSAYPARVYSHLPAEDRSLMQNQLGVGGIIYAINGEPVSRWLSRSLPVGTALGAPSEVNPIGAWLGEDEEDEYDQRHKGGAPKWLRELRTELDKAIADGVVSAEISRTKGFRGDLVLSTNKGDAVLIVSKAMSRAAYVVKKKVDYKGYPTDWDSAVNKMMAELQAKYKRKPRGTKKEELPAPELGTRRQPKLQLRDWLVETGNGYALRRDFRKEDINRLIGGGINYADGKALAESKAGNNQEAIMEHKINMGLGLLIESIDTWLKIMEKPHAIDIDQVMKYLKSAPEEVEDWVSSLEIYVLEWGNKDRWMLSLVERTYTELDLQPKQKSIVAGILEALDAAPWEKSVETGYKDPEEEEQKEQEL